MNKKLLLYLLPLALFACKKDSPQPAPAKPLTSTRTINANGHSVLTTYDYNDKGILWQETTKDENTGLVLYQGYKHKDSQLYAADISSDEHRLTRINYTFAGGKVAKMAYYEYDKYANTELLFERQLEYQNGQLYKIMTKGSDGQPGDYTLFTFASGNIVTAKTYSSNGTALNTVAYEYDDKVNPYFGKYGQLHSALAYNSGNITKIEQTDHLTNTVTTSRYSYTYNSAGQPITQLLAGSPNKLIMTYSY